MKSQCLASLRPEELVRFPILKAQSASETRVLRASADVDTLRGIEPVPLDEYDTQTRQRLPAPADRRTTTVGAVQDVDGDANLFLHPCKDGLHSPGAEHFLCNLRLPGQAEQPPAVLVVSAEQCSPFPEHLQRRLRIDGTRAPDLLRLSTPSHQTIRARFVNEASRVRSNGMVSMRENPSDA